MRFLPLALMACLFYSTEAAAQSSRPDPYSARILLGPESYAWESVREPAPRVASRSAGRRLASTAPAVGASQSVARPIDGKTQSVINYYGAMQARSALSRFPTRPSAGSAPRATRSGQSPKPFNTIVSTPTVSPYLNLHREEEGDAAPNYYAFVRPQQNQIEANNFQARRLQQLERRVNQTSYGAPVYNPSSAGSAARYGDTGRFYGGWQR